MRVVRIPGGGGPPRQPPTGMVAATVGKAVERAFDDALVAVGGTRPTWLILLAVKTGAGGTHSGIAARVGISGPTLTHHLDRLEAAGLLVRSRDPGNRRVQGVELTDAGNAMFFRLRDAAAGFDSKLRAGLEPEDITTLRRLLQKLQTNVAVPATERTTS